MNFFFNFRLLTDENPYHELILWKINEIMKKLIKLLTVAVKSRGQTGKKIQQNFYVQLKKCLKFSSVSNLGAEK